MILNIFPSLDTSVCATSVRKFNKMAAGLKDTVVLAISKDLPFAHGRFCTTEGIENLLYIGNNYSPKYVHGKPVKLIGEFIQVGKVAPDFELVKTDLSSFGNRVYHCSPLAHVLTREHLCSFKYHFQRIDVDKRYFRNYLRF